MIVTLTPNPSIDATIALDSALEPGTVHRAHSMTHVAGGKGINVAHAVTLAHQPNIAVFPAADNDPFVPLVRDINVKIRQFPLMNPSAPTPPLRNNPGAQPSSMAKVRWWMRRHSNC